MGVEAWQYALLPKQFSDENGLVAVGVIDTGEKLQPTGTIMAIADGGKVKVVDQNGSDLSRYGDVRKLGVDELRRRRKTELLLRQARYREKMSHFLTDGAVDVEAMRRMREETGVMQPERENPRIPGLAKMMCEEVERENPGAVSKTFIGRWSDVVENLALLAAVSEKEVGNILTYMNGRIQLNSAGLTQENIARLAGYVTGDEKLKVDNLDGQAREAGEIIVKAIKNKSS